MSGIEGGNFFMGSMSRFIALERLVTVFKNEIVTYFKGIIGLTVGELKEDDLEFGLMISAYVPLIGSPEIEGVIVHLECVTEKEFVRGELIDELSISEFNQAAAGRKINLITLSYSDYDNEAYLHANVEDYGPLEIPLGFNPETLEFHSHLKRVLTKEKRKWFVDNYDEIKIDLCS